MTSHRVLPRPLALLVIFLLMGCEVVQSQVLPEERILSRSAQGFQPDGPWTVVRVENDLAVVLRKGEVEKKVYSATLRFGREIPGLTEEGVRRLQKQGFEGEVSIAMEHGGVWIDVRDEKGDKLRTDFYRPYEEIDFHDVRTGKTTSKCVAWRFMDAYAIALGRGIMDETQDHPLKKEMLVLQADAKRRGHGIWGYSRQVQIENSQLPDGSPGKRVRRLEAPPGFVGQRWRYRGVTDNLEIVLEKKDGQRLYEEKVKLAGICTVGGEEDLPRRKALLEQYFANCRGVSSWFGLAWHTRLSDRKSLVQLYVPTKGEDISSTPGSDPRIIATEWRFVNADLVALGCATVDPNDDVPYMTGLLDLQEHAKKMTYGIWGGTKTMPPTTAPDPEPNTKEEEPLIFDRNGKLIKGTLPKPKESSPDQQPGNPVRDGILAWIKASSS